MNESNVQSKNCELFNAGMTLVKQGFGYEKIEKHIFDMNKEFDLPLEEIYALLRVFKEGVLKSGRISTESLYMHKSGVIGKIKGIYIDDGALFIFEELDKDSGDAGHDNIFYTESYELKECDRKIYDKAFPPEEDCVKWEEHFTQHILVDEGSDMEQQVFAEKCPHCGGYGESGERYEGPYHKIVTNNDMNKVECLKCGAQGPERKCVLESIAAYNERWTE